jgi:hypothetical protein
MPPSIFWKIDQSGDWDTGANWTSGSIPRTGGDVSLTPADSATAPFTVTYDGGAGPGETIDSLVAPSFATFAFDGGSLTITNAMTFDGAVDMSGGMLVIQGGNGATSEIDGGLDLTGGTVEIDNSELDLAGAATLSGSGTISGTGLLYLTGTGSLTIDPGAALSTAQLELGVGSNDAGSTTTLNTDFDFAAAFLIDNEIGDVTLPPPAGGLDIATLNLDGHTLTLDGPSNLNGEIAGPGSVVINGTASIDSYLALTGTAILEVEGLLQDNGALRLGATASDAPELLIDQLGEFDFNTSGTIYNATGLVDNAGSFDVMSGIVATVDDAFTNTGTIDIAATASLTLDNGSADFGGTVEDSGTLDFGGGTFDLDPNLVITVSAWNVDAATIDLAANLSYGGTFASSGTLDLNQWTLTLSGGASLAGTVSGTGSITISGTAASIDATLTNDATITLQNHASLTASAAIHGGGTISVDGTSQADFMAAVDSGQTIDLVAGATIEIGDLASDLNGTQHQDFNATIAGATAQTTILLSDSGLGHYTAVDGYQLSDDGGNTIVSLTDGGATVGSLTLAGLQYTGIEIGPGSIGGTTEITVETPCYCPGTLILTDRGEAPVESLRIGDKVITRSGEARPIKWIGRRSYSGRFIIGRRDILPICIKAGALAEEQPRRDLWISPHHAMFIDGVLIEAKHLVNGIAITQADRVDAVEYLHIELDTHDIIIAEGTLSESFIDDDSRQMFHNAHEYAALYPDAPRVEARFCAPRCSEGYEVEAARRRIAERAGLLPAIDDRKVTLRGFIDAITLRAISGWAQNIEHPEAPVCLDILTGSRLIGRVLANRYRADLERAGLGSGRHAFEFAPPGGLNCPAATIEVRRSHDGASLNRSIKPTSKVTVPRFAGQK